MRKLIIVFSLVLVLLSVALFFIFRNKDNDVEEKTYAIKSSYAYLTEGPLNFNIKLYSNTNKSLISYAKEGKVYLHDQKEENILMLKVNSVEITDETVYLNEKYFEFTLNLEVDIDSIDLPRCYLTLMFANKVYAYEIGSFEIGRRNQLDNILKITNLYGVRKEDDLSLAGIVITINNPTDTVIKVADVSIGGECDVIINKKNFVEISDSLIINDYLEYPEPSYGTLLIKPNQTITYLLPVVNDSKLFLSNCYMVFTIDEVEYYLSNFTFIKTNDLEGVKPYLFEGVIYDI